MYHRSGGWALQSRPTSPIRRRASSVAQAEVAMDPVAALPTGDGELVAGGSFAAQAAAIERFFNIGLTV
jgi:hypothetical protein